MEEKAGLNLYAYVGSNPINAIDPDGRFTLIEALVAVAILATLSAIIYTMTQVKGHVDTISADKAQEDDFLLNPMNKPIPPNVEQAVFEGQKDAANLLQEVPGTEMNPNLDPEPLSPVPDEVQDKADEASETIDAYKEIIDALSEEFEDMNDNKESDAKVPCQTDTPYVLSPLAGI